MDLWKFNERAGDYLILHFYGKTPYRDVLVDIELKVDSLFLYSNLRQYDRVEIVKNHGYYGIRKYSEATVISSNFINSKNCKY